MQMNFLPASRDPIAIEVIRNKVEGISDEMELTLLRSSFSPIVKEGLDASAGLFTADGATLANACAIPAHLGSLVPAVAQIIQTFPVQTMRQGDAYLLNDPYMGGSHLPDIAVVMPIFVDGKVIAFSGTITHHQDVGGMSAGSVPTNATEIFQEGIRIPPLKLLDQGAYNETLVAMLRLNVRIPDIFMGDLNAQISACKVGGRRIVELAGTYGYDELRRVFDALLDRSEALTRAAIRRLPQGTFRHEDVLDNDGIDFDTPIRIAVAVTIKDDEIEFDFTGCSPQTRGPMNCVRSAVQTAAFFAVRALTDPDIPTNGGCFRVVKLVLPPGSIVNPNEPAPVNARSAAMKRIATVILGALAKAMPDDYPADSGSELLVMAFGGEVQGKRFVVGDLVAAGSGAARGFDGVDVIETDMTNCMNLPAEAMEMEAPIRINCVALRRDSGGAGTFRGGLGVVREYEMLADDITLSHRGERHMHAAQGLAGGEPGAMAVSRIERADGTCEIIPSKRVTTLRQGDRLIVETAGGGGYGPAAQRNADAVRRDHRNGKVTAPGKSHAAG